jgi:hypothetical protein
MASCAGDKVMSIPELIALAHSLGIPSSLIHDTLDKQGEDALRELVDATPRPDNFRLAFHIQLPAPLLPFDIKEEP